MIDVEFRSADSGESLGRASMPPEQLPDSFEAQTTLELHDHHYIVTRAEPMTRVEAIHQGSLVLELRQVEVGTIDPSELLMSLPTICDVLPGIRPGTTKLGVDVLELHEDDWRQIEFVAEDARAWMVDQLEAVQRIYREHRRAHGFSTLHVRKDPPTPWLSLPRSALSIFDELGTKLAGVAYRQIAGLVAGAEAWRLASGLQVYARTEDGVCVTLGLALAQVSEVAEAEAEVIAAFTADHGLFVVDWCRLKADGGGEVEPMRELLSRSRGGESGARVGAQGHGEGRTSAGRAAIVDLTAVVRDDLPDDRQAKA